jgi:hypothetical protein
LRVAFLCILLSLNSSCHLRFLFLGLSKNKQGTNKCARSTKSACAQNYGFTCITKRQASEEELSQYGNETFPEL